MRLDNDNTIALNEVHEGVLLVDTARPASLHYVAKLLRLPDVRSLIP